MTVSYMIGNFHGGGYVRLHHSIYGDILLKTVDDENEAFEVMREYIKINNIFSRTTVICFDDVDGERCKLVSFGTGATFIIRVNTKPKYDSIKQLEIDIENLLPEYPLSKFSCETFFKATTINEFDVYERESYEHSLYVDFNVKTIKEKFGFDYDEESREHHWISELHSFFDAKGN